MARAPLPTALACAIALAGLASSVAAQDRQVYRYVDPEGRVIYSDRAPPANAREVQAKRLGANFIENSQMPLAAQQAMERFPVTLYTFECGEVCQSAEALLNRRGVPFSTVNVEDPKGAEQLKNLTGEMSAPVLQVGDKLIAKGYNESKWQALLDEAGYPKTQPQRNAAVPGRVQQPAPAPAPTAAAKAEESASAAPNSSYPRNEMESARRGA
jgi:glutaredoxin